jgi:DNA-binding transcriptional ArsR family regulator
LAEPLDITLTAVFQNLVVLEEGGSVHTKKVGTVRTCRIDTAGLSVLKRWIADRRSIWERRLDRLGELLGESEEDAIDAR